MRAKAAFYSGLAALVRSGMVLGDALGAMGGADGVPELAAAVRSGTPLAEAMAQQPRRFSEEETALVAAGEQTGRLDVVLDQIASILDKRRRAFSRFVNKIGYPLLVFHFAAVLMPFGVIVGLTGRLDIGLALTVGLVIIGGFWAAVIAASIAARDARKRARLRALFEAVPGLGSSLRHQRYALFATVLEASYEAGVTLGPGLRLAARAARAPDVDSAAQRVESGTPLREALPGSGMLPVALTARVATAEHAGELSAELRRIADEEFERSEIALDRTIGIASKGFYALMALAVFAYALFMIGRAYPF
ncbi:MAG: type II secretion system F family protein [Planctomycetota bacterium]|jgi:type II secretory pathway component PulF